MSGGIVDLLLGGAGGGVIGTLGSFAMKWQESKSARELAKINNAHELAMSAQELAVLQVKIANEQKLADLTRDVALDATASASLIASQESDRATYSTVDSTKASGWLIAVDFLRGLMRPVLTIALTSLNGYMTVVLLAKVVDSPTLAQDIVLSSATLAGMTISWWFGARSHAAK